jgi:hypothetical protein
MSTKQPCLLSEHEESNGKPQESYKGYSKKNSIVAFPFARFNFFQCQDNIVVIPYRNPHNGNTED